jgi:hypothetical protein
LVFAGPGAAGIPLGNACVAGGAGAGGGQIEGEGATLQTRAQVAWIQGYTKDVCGFVNSAGPSFTNSPQGSSNSMVIYNGTNDNSQTQNANQGSGTGLVMTSCRGTPYGGTDTPYTEQNMVDLDANPGARGGGAVWTFPGATPCVNTTSAGPPAQPLMSAWLNPFYGSTGGYPFIATGGTATQNQNNSDQPANLMSFPVTGTAVAVGVYFGASPPAGCPTGTATVQFSPTQITNLFGGQQLTWNSIFPGCTLNVTRDVRTDGSGTTQNFKNYLKALNIAGTLCDGVATWASVASTNTNNWPTSAQPGSCSNLISGQGNDGVINGGVVTPGTVFYADLPDFQNNAAAQAATNLFSAELQNSLGTYVDPSIGHHANCDFSVITTPGPSSDGAVGLASFGLTGDNWATDNPAGVHQNVWNKGTGWPACATTFDLVYTGTSQAATTNGTANTNPNQQLNNNMRRTLYSYINYVLNEGQQITPTIYYQSLPQGLLNLEQTGFKANY